MLSVSKTAAKRIRAFRDRRRLSARELAEGLTGSGYFMTQGSLTDIETFRVRTVPVDTVFHAAQFFGVSLQGFFYGPLCIQCDDRPPTGYTCNVCGLSSKSMGEAIENA